MYSPEYRIIIYNKQFKLKKNATNSHLLSDALYLYDARLKSRRSFKNHSKRKLIYKEKTQSETLQFISELNSMYRAIFMFEIERGFKNPRYKGII